MEWVEKNVRSDLRQASKVKGTVYKVAAMSYGLTKRQQGGDGGRRCYDFH